MSSIVQRVYFVLKTRYFSHFVAYFRRLYYGFLGMEIGKGTFLPSILVTWPNKVKLGKFCSIEQGVFFKHDGIWTPGKSIFIGNNCFIGVRCEFNITKKITIGDDCLIASGCKFIDHDHGTTFNGLMRIQEAIEKEIIIGNNVWLGANVIILKGVVIEDGAIIAAGAVLNKHVLKNEIWGGVPARRLGERK